MVINNIELETLGRPFLVAEAGSTHQGDPDTAVRMAEAAVLLGADALTFQEIDEAGLYTQMKDFPVPRQAKVGWDCLRKCKQIAKKAGMAFSICVTDLASLEKAMDVGIDFVKIVSYDITFLPFLEACGRTGHPIFMSTGASTFSEVEIALKALNAAGRVVLYHTDCGYPTKDSEVNLLRMVNLRNKFYVPVGYCDHTDHDLSCLAAASLGAAVIEKHFTLSRADGGSDHMVALEPPEISELFRGIKRVAAILGEGEDRIEDGDRFRRNNLRRSIALKCALKTGDAITIDDLTMLRPPIGLPWVEMPHLLGKRAVKDLSLRHIIQKEDVQ